MNALKSIKEPNQNNKNSLDFNTLGEYYRPINTSSTEYQNQKNFKNEFAASPLQPSNKKIVRNSAKNDPKTEKSLKKKGKFLTLKDSNHRSNNLSCQISRNENNLNEITMTSTLQEKELNNKNLYAENENFRKIKEIKDLILCYICRQKSISPKICPSCQKIVCEKCAKYFFAKNKKCFYCNIEMSFDKMVSIPLIDNISNLIDKLMTESKLSIKPKFKNSKNNNFKEVEKTPQKFLNKNKEIQNGLNGKIETKENIENCQKHTDQPLSYYCKECKKPYCKTCLVFFGSEKNNHDGHKMIEYDKFKNNNSNEIVKQSENLDEKFDEINAYINRCKAMKNCYEFERQIVVKYLNLLIDNYNEQVNENIKILNDLINNYNNYLAQIKKGQKDIQKFYTWKMNDSDNKLLSDIIKINNIKYYTSKEVDSYSNLSSKIFFNVYQTDLKKYIIKNEGFHFKTNLIGSKYQLGLIQKQNEIQIYIYYPLDENIHKKKFILPFVFLRRKNNNWESFELKESLTYKGNNYFIKRFKSCNFSPVNSYIKIKGIAYESWFD